MAERTLTVRVPEDLAKLVQSVARSRDEQVSQVIRRCLRQYVDSSPTQRDLMDAVRDNAQAGEGRQRKR